MNYHNTIPVIACLVCVIGLASCTTPTEPDPPAPEWTLDEKYALDFPEPSGLAYDSENHVLWTISDSTGQIYKLSLTGETLAILPYRGEDPEGITLNEETSILYVVEEGTGEIVSVDMSGNEIDRFLLSSVGATTNRGLEGIAFNRSTQTLLAIRERNPSTWVVVDLDGVEQTRRNDIDFAEDYSGVAYSIDDGQLWVVSDESKMIYRVSEWGDVLESFDSNIKKAEGIVVLKDTLYVVSDSKAELYRFIKR